MAQLRDPVKIRHPKAGEGMVPRRALKHWQELGWVPVDEKAVAKGGGEDKGK